MYQVRSACQGFYCKVVHADRFEFEQALTWLANTVPVADSLQEADTLRDQLKIAAVEASIAFHREYHRRPRRTSCHGSGLEQSFKTWARYDADPRATFKSWTASFLAIFEDVHPSSGAERAAVILRSRFHEPFTLDALASGVGMSRSALTRAFRDTYGLTCREYLTRARLRWFVDQVQTSFSGTEQLAFEAGYASYHNLSDALMQRTGFRPSAVRTLRQDQIVDLLQKRLALSEAES